MSKYPKRPSVLDRDSYWVSVDQVIDGTGVREVELAWCTESICVNRHSVKVIAEDAAMAWYDDTDQSSEARVVLRLERHDGAFMLVDVVVQPRIVAEMIDKAADSRTSREWQNARAEK